jgi:hypothetical protein
MGKQCAQLPDEVHHSPGPDMSVLQTAKGQRTSARFDYGLKFS